MFSKKSEKHVLADFVQSGSRMGPRSPLRLSMLRFSTLAPMKLSLT